MEPLFRTVMSLGIKPVAYLWGLLGGAGAMVSMVKRFDSMSSQKGSHWLFYVQGLFNPIVGSLSAVVACRLASSGLAHGNTEPLLVLAFFAGFGERILNWVGSETGLPKKEKINERGEEPG